LHAEAVFRVEGMDCHEEVVILERRLKLLAGLEAVSVDLIGQRLHVKYDAAMLSTSAMVDAVGQTGMRMWLEHEEPVRGVDDSWRRRAVIGCGALLGGGWAADLAGHASVSIPLLTAATLLGAVFPTRRAITAIRSRHLDINVLMVIAVAGALGLGEWVEAASVVFLFAVAQWLEVRTMERAREAIRALVDLSPRGARVRRDDGEVVQAIGTVLVGDVIVLRPGDKIPLDGVVIEGRSDVNEAPLTGESLPVDKALGDEVFAGTILGRGALDVRVTRVVRDTRLARIIHLVETAQASRAPVQTFIDRFARWYTPAVILLALAVASVPMVGAAPGVDGAAWIYRSLVLLVVACPCALVISTPVSVVSALSAAARHGVLIKGGAHLESLASIRVVAFDKTGTLTKGELSVTAIAAFGSMSARDLLRYAAAVESRSGHPAARAIGRYAAAEGIDVPAATSFASVPGMGAQADVMGHRVVVGSQRMMAAQALPSAPLDAERSGASAQADRWRTAGLPEGAGTPARASDVGVMVDGAIVGAITLADEPRETAREAIALLRENGVRRVVMLTGDHPDTARAIAEQVGIEEHHAALTPEDKHARVLALRESYGPILTVGDGINDAPALSASDVGVAMGAAGSDVALETADVALMSDELLRLPYAVRLARATLRNIKTNVALSLFLKAAFLALALTGSATLWMAVLADTGASVIVVANALRLLRAR
jgi:Cd2+/Zn2+-exporting ATPase